MVIGTVYSKITRKAEGKKASNMGKVYEFFYYMVEAPTVKRWTADGKEKSVTKKEIIKFSLPMGMNPDDFEVADPVEIDFTITGREWIKSDGTKDVINENKITNIKFAPVQGEDGKTTRYVPKNREMSPIPQPRDINYDYNEDLPF